MRYFLKIEDCDANGTPVGKPLPVIAQGEFSGGVLSLEYIFDGAHYSMKISDNRIFHNRYGDTEMKLEFILNERTQGSLKSGGLNGNFDIFTHELKITLTQNGCNAHLEFSEGADDDEKIIKNIVAYAVK